MALTSITVLRRYPPHRGVRQVLVEIVGEGTYTATGIAIPASSFGLNSITAVECSAPYPLVNASYLWDRTNGKLQCQLISTGAEFSGTASAHKIVALVTGR
jgi:hypothetical protein